MDLLPYVFLLWNWIRNNSMASDIEATKDDLQGQIDASRLARRLSVHLF